MIESLQRRNSESVVIMGAGPAGLAAGLRLSEHDLPLLLVEKSENLGGLARTEIFRGYRFDIGGHRFFTHFDTVQKLWETMLGDALMRVSRKSHIFYKGRFFKYPINALDACLHLGVAESFRILLSYLEAKWKPHPEETNLEKWITNRFGKRLYEIFFKSYTEKLWGIPCDEIESEWAAQRIEGLSLKTALVNALCGSNHVRSLISEFHYPVLGPGMMWERFHDVLQERDVPVHFNTEVKRFLCRSGRLRSVTAKRGKETVTYEGADFISTIPLPQLVLQLDPQPPREIIRAAKGLAYRSLILVGLIVNREKLFEDQWLYVHSPNVKVGRIQNFKNWSAALVPDPLTTSLGMEYFSSVDDDLWKKSDQELIDLATEEVALLGLARRSEILDGVVYRQAHAYPVYNREYRSHLQLIRDYLATITNLQTIGRNGLHRYNNMDHSMLVGLEAADNILATRAS